MSLAQADTPTMQSARTCTPGRATFSALGLQLQVPHGSNPGTGARWSTRDLTVRVPAQMSLLEARTAALQAKALLAAARTRTAPGCFKSKRLWRQGPRRW